MQEKKRLRLTADGMPCAICPECQAEIYCLLETKITYKTSRAYPDLQDGFIYSKEKAKEDLEIPTRYEYRCPICHSLIATSPQEAEALFKEPEAEQEEE